MSRPDLDAYERTWGSRFPKVHMSEAVSAIRDLLAYARELEAKNEQLHDIAVELAQTRVKCDRSHLQQVMIQHVRMDIGNCRCGWGVNSGDVGKSFTAHVLDVYEDERK